MHGNDCFGSRWHCRREVSALSGRLHDLPLEQVTVDVASVIDLRDGLSQELGPAEPFPSRGRKFHRFRLGRCDGLGGELEAAHGASAVLAQPLLAALDVEPVTAGEDHRGLAPSLGQLLLVEILEADLATIAAQDDSGEGAAGPLQGRGGLVVNALLLVVVDPGRVLVHLEGLLRQDRAHLVHGRWQGVPHRHRVAAGGAESYVRVVAVGGHADADLPELVRAQACCALDLQSLA
mmetsp:Transcript_58324/g.164678  ORF Transcript_58324/g.164678 Transcript_58324/m.164678 type:complete len:235 (+) Transcript_58324:166-870(+)